MLWLSILAVVYYLKNVMGIVWSRSSRPFMSRLSIDGQPFNLVVKKSHSKVSIALQLLRLGSMFQKVDLEMAACKVTLR